MILLSIACPGKFSDWWDPERYILCASDQRAEQIQLGAQVLSILTEVAVFALPNVMIWKTIKTKHRRNGLIALFSGGFM